MAVYTAIDEASLSAFLAAYDIGQAVALEGIPEGVENSNYLLLTARGRYILTLYEKRVDPADLPFFLGLMDHLAARGVPCPTPIHARDGAALRSLCGRPAAVVSFLDGVSPHRVQAGHCAAWVERSPSCIWPAPVSRWRGPTRFRCAAGGRCSRPVARRGSRAARPRGRDRAGTRRDRAGMARRSARGA